MHVGANTGTTRESFWHARLYGFAGYGAMAPLFGAFHEAGATLGSPAGKSAGQGRRRTRASPELECWSLY